MEFQFPMDGDFPLLKWVFLFISSYLIPIQISMASVVPPIVRVLVDRERRHLKIEGFDVVLRKNGPISNQELAHYDSKTHLPIECRPGGMVKYYPAESKKPVLISGPIQVASLGGFLKIGSSRYRDDLFVYSFNGDCLVVNHIDLEKYVAGVLNSEMSSRWPLPALMAQAVAARTYALYQMQHGGSSRLKSLNAPFDVESNVNDQMYEGANQEHFNTIQAVDATKGLVLSYNSEPIKSFYHSTCGGKTESADRVWGKGYPYMQSVECGFCSRSPRFNWIFDPPVRVISDLLKRVKVLKGDLRSLSVTKINSIGRADIIAINGTLGKSQIKATKLRDLLGTKHIMSTSFSIANSNGKVVFIGHGSGHGVGMCQFGAKSMAERGRDFRDILDHYYPRAQITRMY